MVGSLVSYSRQVVLSHILQLEQCLEGESLIMKKLLVVCLVSTVLLLEVRSTYSSSGFVYDASARLSATYFQEVSRKV